ncbi:hypothetical protein QYF61_019797 [Mycteria americana]|uniref:Uncharacterized protein n=1 Tax=Mycteria americana TaxID=33587 RepID=A0AAN7MTG2_MYCAM|nr:hypothetical protein QYF61_019797 [Mycteria americana]
MGFSTGCRVDICSTVDLHGLQGDSLPHHGLHHGLQGNLCSGTWSTSFPSFFTDLGVCRVQNLAFGLVKFHAINDCPMLQSIQISLQGLLSLKRVNSTSQFSVISKLANGAFNSCLQIIDKNIEQNWP